MRKERNTWTTLPNGARVKKEWIFDAAKNTYKVKKENNLWEEVEASELEKPTATKLTEEQHRERAAAIKTLEQMGIAVYREDFGYKVMTKDGRVFCIKSREELRRLAENLASEVGPQAVGAASSRAYVEKAAGEFIDTGIPVDPTQYTSKAALKESAKLRGSWSGLGDYSNHSKAAYPGACVYPSAAEVRVALDPAADPLAPLQEKANNTYAVDTPEGVKLFPLYPELSARRVIEAAIDKLKKIKKLNINSLYIMKEGEDWRVIYKVISDNLAPDLKQGKLIEVIIHKDSFNRTRRPLDEDASIPRDKDTNDYIILRVAYMLYKLYKLPTEDAKKVANTLITVISSDVKPFFTF